MQASPGIERAEDQRKDLAKGVRVVQNFSPEQIASVVKVSHESIYRRIYAEIKALSWKFIKGTF